MKTKIATVLLLVGAALAGPLCAAEKETSSTPAATAAAPRPNPPPVATNSAEADAPVPASKDAAATNPAGSTAKTTPQGVKGMARDFGEQSKDLLAKRKALLERLNSAKTEEEKEKIIAEIRRQQQQRMEQQRELARNIREQMQATRQRDTAIIATGK